MSKQVIIAVIEDVIGEYVLNMSKKDLKVAMVRGKITLENVQLDGDLIGSHVLGAVGLSGFGILSCSARKLHVTIPWGSLEKTPTKCEIAGVHLVCVPLLPSNATRMCGAGTAADPRCTLRTRAKRAALARYERNFFAGRILGEGPMKNRNRKAELKRRTRAIRMSIESRKLSMASADGESGHESPDDDYEHDVGAMLSSDPNRSSGTTGEIRNALKMKLKAKAFRNIEARIRQIHIRCEVSEGALREESASFSSSSNRTKRRKENTSGRAFAFGCIVDSFVVKTATSDWETGDCIFADDDDPGRTSDTRSVAAARLGLLSSGLSYKVVEFNNVSLYWDDQPPFLVSETELLKTAHNVVPHKVQKRVADAMEAMVDQQDPGERIRISLAAQKSTGVGRKVDKSSGASINGDSTNNNDSTTELLGHDYCCLPFNLTFHSSFSDPAQEGPSQWEAELLPFELHLLFKPHQYQQYQQLRKVMFEQRRVDTMLHKRPERTVLSDPRAWWKFAISAVIFRPNSRPWRDVKRVASSRPRYVELVRKKILNARNGTGFHGGLNDEESFELLALEDALPIEALLAFHLLALRKVYHEQTAAGEDRRREETLNSLLSKSKSSNPTKARGFKRISRKLLVGSGGSAAAEGTDTELEKRSDHDTKLPQVSSFVTSSALCSPDDSLIQMLFIVRDMFISVSLLDSSTGMPFVRSEFHAEARIFSSGLGINVKKVTLDLKRVDVDSIDESNSRKVLSIGSQVTTPSRQARESNQNVPCSVAACRLMASRELNSLALDISARPATLIWNSNCFEKFASFLASHEEIIQDMIRSKLRKAATPLAYKAQVAILSPQALSVELNIDAPKVWLPIISSGTQTSDGALYFDAGLLEVSLSKGEGIANTSVLATISQINVKYCDSVSGFVLDNDGSVVPYVSMVNGGDSKEDVSVVRPFSVHIDATIAGDQARWGGSIASLVDQIDRGEGRYTASSIIVSVGDIYLDLVDADVLAKGIGKVYAAKMIQARQRREDGSTLDNANGEQSSHRFGTSQSTGSADRLEDDKSLRDLNSPSESISLTVTLERVELALEGRATDKSVSRRNYIVQLLGMNLHYAKLLQEKLSKLSISEANVTESDGVQIFGRCATPAKRNRNHKKDGSGSFIRASFLRNGKEHTNELDILIDSFLFVVTPIAMMDYMYIIVEIFELSALVTQQIERKIHETARDRRNKNKRNRHLSHSPTNKAIVVDGNTGVLVSEEPEAPFPAEGTQSVDSSLSFRLTTNAGTLLIWGSEDSVVGVPSLRAGQAQTQCSAVALEIVSDALVMFQSIENDDQEASGTKTLHISFRDLSAAIKGTTQDSPSSSIPPPVLEPAAADFRVTYSTQNLGSVVSQDFSLHCDCIKSSLSLAHAAVLKSMSELMSKTVSLSKLGLGSVPADRVQYMSSDRSKRKKKFGLGSIQYKKSGSGIATSVRLEVDSVSCVIQRPRSPPVSITPLFACNIDALKGSLGGCVSALFGDIQATAALHYFRADVQQWEHLVEPFRSSMMIEQMPNEIIVSATTLDNVSANFTSVLLSDIAKIEFNCSGRRKTRAEPKINTVEKRETPPMVDQQQVSLFQAGSIYVVNECGCDIVISPMSSMSPNNVEMREIDDDAPGCVLIRDGSKHELCSETSDVGPSFAVGVPTTMNSMIGKREALLSLRVENCLIGARSLHPLRPPSINQSDPCTSSHTSARGLYDIEPVVEWCLENQRLRPSVADVYSLSKGRDLLSSHTWSPGDECYAGRLPEHTMQRRTTTPGSIPGNWTCPDDIPEFTDISGTLKLARERVVLPDDSWMWASTWEVHVCGDYGDNTDADGWEYEADFAAFKRSRRSYRRGDTCRRRRWSRTRMIKPPKLDDQFRPLSFIMESRRQADGSLVARLSSPVSVLNNTSETITIFLNNASWEKEIAIGETRCKEALKIPIFLASASFMRLAIARTGTCIENMGMQERGKATDNYFYSEMVMIIPTGFQSSTLRKASIIIDGDQRRKLHFNVNIQCTGDETQIVVEPVLQVINALPCHFTYRVGEKGRGSTSVVERGRDDIGVGAKNDCVSVSARFKPHISVRLPGYDWSRWKAIVNRKLSSMTWVPSMEEEEQLFRTRREDVDRSDDYKTVIELDRNGGGDRLTIIMSIEASHTPIIRFYAQYWILDKTGFSLRYAEGSDALGSMPSSEHPLRRTHHYRNPAEAHSRASSGHQWSLGMDGTSMYFSRKERLAIAIENVSERRSGVLSLISKWSDPVDVANVMPRNTLSLDEYDGDGRYELSLSVESCPSLFSRTKLITIVPRYQIQNHLAYGIFLAQNGRLDKKQCIPSQKSAAFHWTMASSLPPRVRVSPALNASSDESKDQTGCQWTNGSIELDKVGITSMRMSTPKSDRTKPEVIQVEVRLATKAQNSAVLVVISDAGEEANSLYLLRNMSSRTVLVTQPLYINEAIDSDELGFIDTSLLDKERTVFRRLQRKESARRFAVHSRSKRFFAPFSGFDCGVLGSCAGGSVDDYDTDDEGYVWTLSRGDEFCFGFDDPEKPHLVEWTCANGSNHLFETTQWDVGVMSVDAIGSNSTLRFPDGGEVRCIVKANHGSKVIEFADVRGNDEDRTDSLVSCALEQRVSRQKNPLVQDRECLSTLSSELEDYVTLTLRADLPVICFSVVDNVSSGSKSAREVLLLHMDSVYVEFGQSRRGYHEVEMRIASIQIDNHVHKSIHSVALSCPRTDQNEPFLHFSAVRHLQPDARTFIFPYVALRILPVDLSLDRRTTEAFARFFEPMRKIQEEQVDPEEFLADLTSSSGFTNSDLRDASLKFGEEESFKANSDRICIEKMILHPIRISLTFSQQGFDESTSTDGPFFIEFFRSMASITAAPLTFTSFVVGHAFESPRALARILTAHYTSQLFQQVFAVLGSLEILTVPADLLGNVGTGVISFFYEPLQGLVQGPSQFIEGLETGTQSLVRGVFVGVVKSAASVTDMVNTNLAGLTADESFIGERNAHQKSMSEARSRGQAPKSISDSFALAGASIARSVKSGAAGIVEQPSMYASKHGPIGFVKGMAKACVGAVVKPVVGFGDAAVLVLTHMSEATSDGAPSTKVPKRMRRALPLKRTMREVNLVPFDAQAADAQRIVTENDSSDDVYVGHVCTPTHLLIASENRLISIERNKTEPQTDVWPWADISHFSALGGKRVRVSYFSSTGIRSRTFSVESAATLSRLHELFSLKSKEMTNALRSLTPRQTRNFDSNGEEHIFGRCNIMRTLVDYTAKDEIDVIEQRYSRVRNLSSSTGTFFKRLDEEAWTLIDSWRHLVSGLRSRRCLVVGIINGTGANLQIKSTKLLEGGSPCYSLPTSEFDDDQGLLGPGGAIIYFVWGNPPNLNNHGDIFLNVETNAFTADFAGKKSTESNYFPRCGYKLQFLEKSFDPSGWWAKFWLMSIKV